MVLRGGRSFAPATPTLRTAPQVPDRPFRRDRRRVVCSEGCDAQSAAWSGVGDLVSLAVGVDGRWRWGIRNALGRLRARDVGARTTMARTNQPHCGCGAAAFGRGWCELTCARERYDRLCF